MIEINVAEQKLSIQDRDGQKRTLDLYSDEGFDELSKWWVKVGWNQKYTYTFSWFGRPIIQLPDDLVRLQEAFYEIQPDYVVETGIAHGGSLIFYASLCRALKKGRVVGVDIEIRPHNRKAIEEHPFFEEIDLIEGDSVSEETVGKVSQIVKPGGKTIVVLDSCHTEEHVYKELNAYKKFVTPGSYMIATDGVMINVFDTPRGTESWKTDNPVSAVKRFLLENSDFELVHAPRPFSESTSKTEVTHFPSAWLKRKN